MLKKGTSYCLVTFVVAEPASSAVGRSHRLGPPVLWNQELEMNQILDFLLWLAVCVCVCVRERERMYARTGLCLFEDQDRRLTRSAIPGGRPFLRKVPGANPV